MDRCPGALRSGGRGAHAGQGPGFGSCVRLRHDTHQNGGGAVLFAAVYEPGALFDAGAVPGFVAGGAIAVLVAGSKVIVRPPSRSSSAGVSTAFLSAMEDIVAVVGGVVGLFLPFLPLLFVGFLLFFFNRIRKRRGRKYGGLRILGD